MDKAEEKKDADCMKKATTDGLTKCLSMMGFNADIFLGKFDDSKYVQQVKAEFEASKPRELDNNDKAWIDAVKADPRVADSIEDPEYKALIIKEANK